jgi:hypothetical protein
MYRDMEMTFWLPETTTALAEMGPISGERVGIDLTRLQHHHK